MALFRSSRYLRQEFVLATDAQGMTRRVPGLRDTTVFESERPADSLVVTPDPGMSFPLLARKYLGRHQYWWIIADMNPQAEVFYPLDYEDGMEVAIPPQKAVDGFRRRQRLR